MTQAKPIKASLRLSKMAPGDVMARANAVVDGLYAAKDAYPNPPIDKPALQGQIERVSAALTAALDGGRKAIAERNHETEVLRKSLRGLARYVEANCKDDMPTFLLSGFQPVTTARVVVPPASESIRKVVPGENSGQMLVTIVADPDAFSYELRWAPAGAGGIPENWTFRPVGNTKPPAMVTGLTPGTAYAFQIRAVTESGYSDWSESVTRICT